jgi:hypothetical protein
MITKHRVTTIVLILFLIGILSFMWNRYLKELVIDDGYRTIDIELNDSSQLIELTPYKKNDGVYAISLKIAGESSKNIQLLLGIEKDQFINQVSLKKGNVLFEYDSDWYVDQCYVFISEKAGQSGKLTLEYKFMYINKP